jgi:hypothetical protein
MYDYIQNLISPSANDLYDIRSFDDGSQDLSLISRLNQWGVYIFTLFQSKVILFSFLFGSGLNSGGITCDGQYIKNFVDIGILGSTAYVLLLIKGLKSKSFFNFSILIFISSLTLDIFWASKFMYMLCILFYPLYLYNNSLSKS